jgi:hypothetical protein
VSVATLVVHGATNDTSVGDTDGDGIADVAVARVDGDDPHGTTFVVIGPPSGTTDLDHDADSSHRGEVEGDAAGVVAVDGDANGDGYDDLLIGAPRHDGTATDAGAVYVVLGPMEGDHGLEEADGKITASTAGQYKAWLGASIAYAGDVDADGLDDVIMSKADDSLAKGGGGAALFYGPVDGDRDYADADASFYGLIADDGVGFTVAGVGDLEGDGFADVLLGASGDSAGVGGPWYGNLYLFGGGTL